MRWLKKAMARNIGCWKVITVYAWFVYQEVLSMQATAGRFHGLWLRRLRLSPELFLPVRCSALRPVSRNQEFTLQP